MDEVPASLVRRYSGIAFGGTGKAVTMSQIAYQGFQPLGALLHKTDLQLKFQNRSLESLQKLRLY